jgi:PAS domain S-box-containing protein
MDNLQILQPKLLKAEQAFITQDSHSPLFLTQGESSQLHRYEKYIRQIRRELEELGKSHLTDKLGIRTLIYTVSQQLTEHNRIFLTLKDKIKIRGLKDYGTEGKMRKSSQEMQGIDSLNQILLLTMLRYEKDYFLKNDIGYVDSLRVQASLLITDMAAQVRRKDSLRALNRLYYRTDTVSRQHLANIVAVVNEYVRQFEKIITLDDEIGLSDKAGLQGELAQNTLKIEKELHKIDELIELKTHDLYESSTWLLIIFYIVVVVLAIIFAVIISYRIAIPIVTLDRVAQSVSKGLRNQERFLDRIKSNDEVGSLAKNFKSMLLKLKDTIFQANEKSRKLEEFAETEARRTWLAEGLTIFNEILRNNQTDLDKQAFDIIAQLVKYTKSAQGGLFVVNRENTQNVFLELRACYAYERQKYQKKRIEKGEGLVGTAWREGEKMVVSDIPQEYMHIKSGLGKAAPQALLIMPIISDEEVEGVLELAAFHRFQDYEIEFIETLSNRIGNALVALKANQKTRDLLEISERIAAEAQSKEAQLRKQLEEYRAWIQEFETKLNVVAEEATIYNAILGKVYSGMFITDEQFRIHQVNAFVAKKLGYKRPELQGRPVDLFLETDNNLWKEHFTHKFALHSTYFNDTVYGKITDRRGNTFPIEIVAGRIEVEDKVMHVFLFNETEVSQARQGVNLKVAS